MSNTIDLRVSVPTYHQPVESSAPKEKPKPIEYQSSMKAMTGQSIIDQMGAPPKDDVKLGKLTLYTRSTEYKDVLKNLETFHKLSDSVKSETMHGAEPTLARMKSALEGIVSSTASYIGTHDGDDAKGDRRAVMSDLQKTALQELSFVDKLIEHSSNFYPTTTLGEATALLRGGVDHIALLDTSFNDTNMVGKPVPLGSGMINTVSLVTYRTTEGASETRVLKPLVNEKDKSLGKDAFIGIDLDNLRSAQRNLASASVADLLGQSDMIPKSEIVLHEGVACLSMKVAEGEDLLGVREVVHGEGMQSTMDQWEKSGDTGSLEMMRAVRNSDNVWVSLTDAPKAFPVTSKEPSELTGNVQKKMLDLQVVDMLCGQVDRHQHNFFIKIEGTDVKLTGIDNDTAFGELSGTVTNITTDGAGPRIKVPWPGLPPLMSSDMFDKLMDLRPEALTTALERSGLTDKEIGATLVRLEGLQSHARTLESQSCIVDDFTTWSGVDPKSNERMNASDFMMASTSGSYVRQFGELSIELASRGTLPVPLKEGVHDL